MIRFKTNNTKDLFHIVKASEQLLDSIQAHWLATNEIDKSKVLKTYKTFRGACNYEDKHGQKYLVIVEKGINQGQK